MTHEDILKLSNMIICHKFKPTDENYAEILAFVLNEKETVYTASKDPDDRSTKLFFDRHEADMFSDVYGKFYGEPRPEVIETTLSELSKKKGIDTVEIVTFAPISITVKFIDLFGTESKPQEKTDELPSHMEMNGEDYISYVKDVLETLPRAERAKYKDASEIMNVHELLDRLLTARQISRSEFDHIMNYTEGFTEKFIQDIGSADVPKDVLLNILEYFGLHQYLYRYKKFSKELIKELKNNASIDEYTVTEARVKDKEPFVLTKIKKGIDKNNHNVYIYRLFFKSDYRDKVLTISNPMDYVIGKKYKIDGLPEVSGLSDETSFEPSPKPAKPAAKPVVQESSNDDLEGW